MTGCIRIEVTSVTIQSNGKVVDEIMVVLDEEAYQGVNVSVRINDGENLRNKKVDVTWEIVGETLGCEIWVIDPCCTGGRIAFVKLGDSTGDIVVRVTVKSKNEKSANLIITII